MAERVPKEICNWYSGPSFFEIVENLPVPERKSEGALRFPVLDKMRDQGLSIFGKVESGILTTGNGLI
jgi:peptide chain release factor subunit 3